MKKKIILFVCLISIFSFSANAKKKEESDFSYKDLKPTQKLVYLANLLMSGHQKEAFQLILEGGKLKLDDKSKERFQFMQGYVALMQGNAEQANQIFSNLSGKYKELDPILPYWLARSQRMSGKASDALKTLDKVCGGSCSSSSNVSPRVLREYASSLCAAKEGDKAQSFFNELINSQKKDLDKEYTRLDLIECLKSIGNSNEAYEQLRNSYMKAQGGIAENYLQKILKDIHQKDSKIPPDFSANDTFSRIDQLKNQDRYVEAANDYKALWPSLDSSSQQSRALDAAEVYFKARYYKDAADRYAELVHNTSDTNLKSDYLDKLASSYARSNQFDKAIATQKDIAAQNPGDSSKTSWKIAFLYYDGGQCDKAVEAFDQFLQSYPSNPKTEEARWRKAWCLAQLKKYNESIRELEGLEKSYPKKVVYWKMRWLEESGQKEELKAAKAALNQDSGFYSRWEDIVRQNQAHSCPQVNPFKILSKKDSPPNLPVASEQEKTLKELLLLGLWEDFIDYYGQQNASSDLIKDRMNDWVEFFAYVEQIPPELIWAIMKEESHFNPKALSPVGAMGLMQIIPQTGYEIAEDLNLSSYTSDDLMKPLINLRFGSHYLSKLNRQFSGNIIQTIAAYNAGPLAVERWSTQRQNQACDEFIEQIPYKETYNYVMKVMQSLWSYQGNKKGPS